MTTYVLPAALRPAAIELTLLPNIRTATSPYTQGSQVIDLLGERWRMALELSEDASAGGAARDAFFAKLRGGAHLVQLHHFARPVPIGTLRGTPTLAAAATQGADNLAVNTIAGATLKAGDLIGVLGMLLMVRDDCAAVGSVITVPLANRLRKAAALGSAVIWDKPSADFRLTGSVPVGHRSGRTALVRCEFLEHWQ